MAYAKLVVDGKTIVAFQERLICDQYEPPEYIKRYLHLAGCKVENATTAEYKKYKRTRKKRQEDSKPQPLF